MQTSPKVRILVGAQWGDEGKGKWIDVLAEKADLVVRYQGGNNAGHTLHVNGRKVVLHQVPSGVFHEHQKSALGAGMVVNPVALVEELAKVRETLGRGIGPDRLWISERAHVVTPWHIFRDAEAESRASRPIGTTKRGIGPTYADKAARLGLRFSRFVDHEARHAWIARLAETEPKFREHYERESAAWDRFHAAAKELAPYACDAEHRIRQRAKAGDKILLEGAQATLLDLDHGTYPYVTSSSTTAGGACQSIGLSPRLVNEVIGIAKAYMTRVGEGPFPTELHDEVGELLRQRGQEFGATTGRPRRCGWLDAVALRFAVDVNGLDGIVLNKMDILTGLPEIKIATSYEHPRLGRITEFPGDAEILAECRPVYETFPGWTTPIPTRGRVEDLPTPARQFVEAVERHAGTRVLMVGTGPGREDALYR